MKVLSIVNDSILNTNVLKSNIYIFILTKIKDSILINDILLSNIQFITFRYINKYFNQVLWENFVFALYEVFAWWSRK